MPTAVDDSPSPSPRPSTNPFGLGFRPATPGDLQSSPLPSPDPSTSESLDDELEQLAASDSGDAYDETSYPDSLDGTPSPASSPASEAVDALDSEGLRDAARAAVAIAGQQAHEHLARTPGQADVGLYLTDTEDQAGIGDPLARIAARHQGIGKVSPDTADLLASMMGIARYATKQITLAKEAKGRDLAGAGPQPMPQAVDL